MLGSVQDKFKALSYINFTICGEYLSFCSDRFSYLVSCFCSRGWLRYQLKADWQDDWHTSLCYPKGTEGAPGKRGLHLTSC